MTNVGYPNAGLGLKLLGADAHRRAARLHARILQLLAAGSRGAELGHLHIACAAPAATLTFDHFNVPLSRSSSLTGMRSTLGCVLLSSSMNIAASPTTT